MEFLGVLYFAFRDQPTDAMATQFESTEKERMHRAKPQSGLYLFGEGGKRLLPVSACGRLCMFVSGGGTVIHSSIGHNGSGTALWRSVWAQQSDERWTKRIGTLAQSLGRRNTLSICRGDSQQVAQSGRNRVATQLKGGEHLKSFQRG